MPLNPLAKPSAAPEIFDHLHFGLTEWALKLAFSIDDVETGDTTKSAIHEGNFERLFGQSVPSPQEAGRKRRTQRPSRYGGI